RRFAGAALDPALILIRATPVIAVILLALIWFRPFIAPVFVTILMVLPVVVENVSAGTRAASGELREMAELFRVSRRRQILDLVLPALRPYLFASAHSGLGMAFKVTVAAEVIVQPGWALGGAMQEARFYLDTPRILALTLSVIGVSALAELVLRGLERAVPAATTLRSGRETRRREARVAARPQPSAGQSLTVSHLHHSYGTTTVLGGLSFTLDPGVVTVVVGPSGCGKTTLLRLIAGLDTPHSGAVDRVPPVSMVFQEPRLLPWATARQNLDFVLGERDGASTAEAYLAAVSLPSVGPALPTTLSGGMQQRVSLARALAYGGSTLLLDEPFQNLDLPVKLELARAVRETTRRRNLVSLMVTHDVVEALATGDRVLILGRDPARVIADETIELAEGSRDPRSVEHQRHASILYDRLLSAR
ncbi:MAG: ATP-binding cassette domain-containing protein, partial [Spirochaetota bacterium]